MRTRKPTIRKEEPLNWTLETVEQNDPTLTPPRGTSNKQTKINHAEAAKLDATRINGGLLKERWRWVGGKPVFDGYIMDKKAKRNAE